MSRPQSASRKCTKCGDLGKYRERVMVRRGSKGDLVPVVRWFTCECHANRTRVRLGKVIKPVPLMGPVDYPVDANKPKNRSECKGGLRPCPFVSCRFNTYLDVTAKGWIHLTREGLEPDEVPEHLSCAEDMADRARAGDQPTLEEVGQAIGVTRERVRQIEDLAIAKVEIALKAIGITKKDVFK